MARVARIAGEVLQVASSAVPDLGRTFLAAGVVAWDDCCDGQLWVRVISYRPVTSQSGQRQRSPGVISLAGVTGWILRLGIGVLQCASTIDDRGRAPAPATLTGEAVAVMDTAETLMCALLENVPYRYRPMLIDWTPLGPDGACQGGEWALDLNLEP